MKSQPMLDIDRLLRIGAGVDPWSRDGLRVDQKFQIVGIKGEHFATLLIRELVREMGKDESLLTCDYVATFEERPATVKLARLLALELQQKLDRRVGLLVVSRHGHLVTFRYIFPEKSGFDQEMHLDRLVADATSQIIRNKRVLLFTDVLRGQRDEGIIRMFYAASVRRTQTHIIGLAACCIQRGGIRTLLRRADNGRKIPVAFSRHMRDITPEPPVDKHGAAKLGGLARALRKAFSRTTA